VPSHLPVNNAAGPYPIGSPKDWRRTRKGSGRSVGRETSGGPEAAQRRRVLPRRSSTARGHAEGLRARDHLLTLGAFARYTASWLTDRSTSTWPTAHLPGLERSRPIMTKDRACDDSALLARCLSSMAHLPGHFICQRAAAAEIKLGRSFKSRRSSNQSACAGQTARALRLAGERSKGSRAC